MNGQEAEAAVAHRINPDAKSPFDNAWKDAKDIATTQFRTGALDLIADPTLGTSGTILVELELNHPHPYFYGIVRTDERGIWYADGDGHVNDPAWRLRLIPWGHVEEITLHQAS